MIGNGPTKTADCWCDHVAMRLPTVPVLILLAEATAANSELPQFRLARRSSSSVASTKALLA